MENFWKSLGLIIRSRKGTILIWTSSVPSIGSRMVRNLPKRSPALSRKREDGDWYSYKGLTNNGFHLMETFLDYVIKGLVDRPDAVTITPTERNGMTVYELRVHPTDMGKIIGRQGATINAVRALLLVGSAKRGLRCALEVVDEEGSEGGGRSQSHSHEHGGHSHSHSHSHGHSHSHSHGPSDRRRSSGGTGRSSGGERRGTYSRY